jgi:hypothetical protein
MMKSKSVGVVASIARRATRAHLLNLLETNVGEARAENRKNMKKAALRCAR